MKPYKVLIAIHDPGGTKSITPAAMELLKSPQAECAVLGSAFAEGWLKSLGISFQPLSTNLTPQEAEKVFDSIKPDRLLTGTSWNSNAEQVLRNEAARRKVSSFVFFDFWMNYAKRFMHAGYPITQTPDWLCVADEEMGQEAVSEGFPVKRIRQTGHPHLDYLSRNRTKFMVADKQPYRAIILSEDYPENYLRSLDRHPILVMAESYSHWLGEQGVESANLDIKLHPKEDLYSFTAEALKEVANIPRLNVKILDQKVTILNSLADYSFAFGYQSMALFETAALGVKTVAIPLLKGDRYPSLFKAMALCGVRCVRLNPLEITAAIRELHLNPAQRQEKYPFDGAAKRLADLVLKESP